MTQLKHVTYANVTATLALALALGMGTSYAAEQVVKLPKNSVGAKQIKANAVGNSEMKDNAITSAEILDGTVTTGDVTDGSLTGTDIANGTVGSADVTDNSLLGSDITDGTVGTQDVTDSSLTGTDISNGTVGSADITDNSVGSGDITDGQVGLADLAPETRNIFAQVNANGTLAHGSRVISSTRTSLGRYDVTFNRSLTGCAAVAEPFATQQGDVIIVTQTVGGVGHRRHRGPGRRGRPGRPAVQHPRPLLSGSPNLPTSGPGRREPAGASHVRVLSLSRPGGTAPPPAPAGAGRRRAAGRAWRRCAGCASRPRPR